jgi:hypothetical protein
MQRLFACLTFGIALAACQTASSSDLKTSGFYAEIGGTADGSGSTLVTETIRLGSLSTTYVVLSAGDTITAKSGSDSPHTLSKSEFLGIVNYVGTLSGDDEGKSFTVALNRGSGDTSAPNSSFTLPAKLELTSPAAGTTFVRGRDPITVSWDNSGKPDKLSVELTGTCIDSIVKSDVTDNGTLVIGSSEVKASKDNETKTCELTLRVGRLRTGTLDSAYGKGGTSIGQQVRTLTIKSGP